HLAAMALHGLVPDTDAMLQPDAWADDVALSPGNHIATTIPGAQLLPDNAQWTNRFQIRSESSSRLYTVAQRRSDGSWACSCMGWIRNRHCKHLDRLSPLLD